MKRKILLFTLIVCSCLPAVAQPWHEFSFNAGGGLSSLQYTPPASAKYSPGFGGEFGIGYHYFFSPQWGIGTGLNLAFYNSKASVDNYSAITPEISAMGTAFDFAYTYSNYEEKLSAVMLNIPLMLQFQTTGKVAFVAALGGKIGFPLCSQVTTNGDLYTTGYFLGTKVLYYDDLPLNGFSRYNVSNQKSDVALKPSFMLSAEIGSKWHLNEVWSIYTGIYFDYGLNNCNKSESDILTYNPAAMSYPEGFNYSSLAATSNKLAPLAIGLKIRIGLSGNPWQTNSTTRTK